MGVLTALAILAGLIVVHEAGHFFAATWQGIRVSSFSIGFGPVLLERRRRGVQFALRAIPLGGFVPFPDDEYDCAFPADDPDLLRNRPLPQRALVIAAGVMANDVALDVVSSLYRYAGGDAIRLDGVVQRCRRDLDVAQSHLVVSDSAYENHGAFLLGVTDTFRLG